jgi:nucleoside-diphosphate-sugar epimerase
VTELRQRNLTVDQAVACLRFVWHSSVLDAVSLADPEVGTFDGVAHSRTVAEFRAADTRHIETTPARIRRAVAEHVIAARDAYPTESQLVTHEAGKKRRREPVRGTEELDEDTYGPLKVACEDDVTARYGSRATIVRPGKVAGPHDVQDGLTYWVRHAARGGRVALPGDPEQPVQVIDPRDLARLVVQLLADDRPGAFHAVGPAEPVTLGGSTGRLPASV